METWVWPLIPEDPTCCRAAKPMNPNYQTCALEFGSCNYWRTHVLCNNKKPPQWEAWVTQLESSTCLLQPEKSLCSNKDPAQPKVNTYNYLCIYIYKICPLPLKNLRSGSILLKPVCYCTQYFVISHQDFSCSSPPFCIYFHSPGTSSCSPVSVLNIG